MPLKRTLCALVLTSSALCALSLDEAVALGLKHNHRLTTAALQTDFANAKVDESRSRYFGEIDAVATYVHHNTARTLYPLTPDSMASGSADVATTKDLFTTGLRYDVPLFSGYALEDDAAVAQLQKKRADLNYRLGREELIYTIRGVYVDALSLRAAEKTWRAYSDAMDHLYENTRKKVALGKTAALELLKIDAERLRSETERENLGAKIQAHMSLLSLLIGSAEPVSSLEEVAFAPPGGTLTAQEESSRIAIAKLDVETAKKNLHKSNAAFLPQVGMEAYYGYSYGPNSTSNPFGGDWEHQELWSVGLNAQWSLWDFGKSSARKQQAQIARLQEESKTRQARLQIAHEMREAQLNFRTSQRQYDLAQKQFELMQKSEEIETLRYREGQIDMNDLLIQKASTQQALGEMIASRYSVSKSYYALEYLYEQGDSL